MEQKETVYISQPEHHQIIRIKKLTGVSDSELEINSEPFIGNGERCLPGDSDGCGDGGKAIKARLTYPKGIFQNSFCLIKSEEKKWDTFKNLPFVKNPHFLSYSHETL